MARKSAIHGESGYERVVNDAYMTPPWCTECLLRHVPFKGTVLEPAAGDGCMVDVLKGQGHDVMAFDIAPQRDDIVAGDFFSIVVLSRAHNIITNPPYSHALAFVEHALKLVKTKKGKVAMLLRNEFDSAATRQHLFSEHPAFALKLVLTKRPRWFEDDRASPRHNFSWFVWDWRCEIDPQIRWDQ